MILACALYFNELCYTVLSVEVSIKWYFLYIICSVYTCVGGHVNQGGCLGVLWLFNKW